jgi:hypothetical protein
MTLTLQSLVERLRLLFCRVSVDVCLVIADVSSRKDPARRRNEPGRHVSAIRLRLRPEQGVLLTL